MNTIQDIETSPLFKVKAHFAEAELLKWDSFLTQPYLEIYYTQLLSKNKELFNEKHTLPYFDEEDIQPFENIWEIHHNFLNLLLNLSEEAAIEEARQFLITRDYAEFLLILGQRFTPASIKTSEALPLSKETLLLQAFKPYNTEIKIAVRAWEKHVGRTETDFWGDIKGKPSEREVHVKEIVQQILQNHHWWNVFGHYKHGNIYEVREKSGHGLRWDLNKKEFIGFVEPFNQI